MMFGERDEGEGRGFKKNEGYDNVLFAWGSGFQNAFNGRNDGVLK